MKKKTSAILAIIIHGVEIFRGTWCCIKGLLAACRITSVLCILNNYSEADVLSYSSSI